MKIDPQRFSEPGLYLIFAEDSVLELTRSAIENLATVYLSDPERIPDSAKQALAFKPCSICPKRDTVDVCHAIPVVFPFLEDADGYLSHDHVIAVFREGGAQPGMLHVIDTTMQRALQYVSILGLMYYCEVGRKYFKYFEGVIPFMDPVDIAGRLYLNLYWERRGDLESVNATIRKMQEEITVTTRCQVERLRLICHSDSLANAFVNTQIATQILEFGAQEFLAARMNAAVPAPATDRY